MAKPGNTIHIPIPFDQTIAAVLKVKPPVKTPKVKAKRAGGKTNKSLAKKPS
jgi:hypothetical protein